MSSDIFRSSVKVTTQPEEITQQGKICFYDGYLYMSEPGKGIHIIDNRNPSSPAVVGFIELLGNADLAIRNDLLYADSYVDLVWFDISNPAIPALKPAGKSCFLRVIRRLKGIIDSEVFLRPEELRGLLLAGRRKR